MKISFIVLFCLFSASYTSAQHSQKTKIKFHKKSKGNTILRYSVKNKKSDFNDSPKITIKHSSKINSGPANGEIIVGTDASGRTIYQGPDQKKYYINKQGQKQYVKGEEERLFKKQ